jgi:ectoine hydroxylase-related dioxygenase (phytanoyl-CoA dioxygenase family)
VQVALTFPPHDQRPGMGHVDGLTPLESDGRPGSFTMLAGIVLSDQTRDDMGNLWVWPGSHARLSAHLASRGPDALVATGGYPPDQGDQPVQVHAAPGDLLLASYLLSHNIGGNTSPVLRRSLYYRLSVAGHPLRWRDAVTDWLSEFPAVAATLGGPGGAGIR